MDTVLTKLFLKACPGTWSQGTCMCQLTRPLVYGLPYYVRTAIGRTDVFSQLQMLLLLQSSKTELKKLQKVPVLHCKPAVRNWRGWDVLYFITIWSDMRTMAQ